MERATLSRLSVPARGTFFDRSTENKWCGLVSALVAVGSEAMEAEVVGWGCGAGVDRRDSVARSGCSQGCFGIGGVAK